MSSGSARACLFLALAAHAAGCNTTKFAVDTASDLYAQGEPVVRSHWDYEFVGEAAPANLLQLEAVLRISPDNEVALLSLAQGYTGYAFGWIEDELDRVPPDNIDEAQRLRQRARLMYQRAAALAFRVLANHDGGFTAAKRGPLPAFQSFLATHYVDKDDAAALLWAGSALASAINVSRDDPALVADLGFARALVERSVALDPAYFHHSGQLFMAMLMADFPPSLGGDPEGGRRLFEDLLAKTRRSFHFVQLQYARTYCVQTHDRARFHALLMEIMEAGDVNPEVRLYNKIARRRAVRYLAQADEFFAP